MIKPPSNNRGRVRVDLDRIARMTADEIMRASPAEFAQIVKLPDDFFHGAVAYTPPLTRSIALNIDEDILAWFKSLGPRYQSRMNAVLRAYMQATRKPPAKRRKGKQ